MDVSKVFSEVTTKNKHIFMPLNEKELGNAGVQSNRDNLAD